MFKAVITDVIVRGKQKEYKDLVERANKILEKYGLSFKTWNVKGRKGRQIFVEFEAFESESDYSAAWKKASADKDWQDWAREQAESGCLVKGAEEWFLLAD